MSDPAMTTEAWAVKRPDGHLEYKLVEFSKVSAEQVMAIRKHPNKKGKDIRAAWKVLEARGYRAVKVALVEIDDA